MRILFDTNIILDVMLVRKPFVQSATHLLSAVERKCIQGFIASTTVTTIWYIVQKYKGKNIARSLIDALLKIFEVAEIDKVCLEAALHSKVADYEDAVLDEVARRSNLDGIVTRNVRDFKFAYSPVFDPTELVKILDATRE